jgi:chloramphenicol-sensitive protein RarD
MRGLVYGLSAYGLWGLIPIYFKAASAAPPLELLAHRVVWAFLLVLVVAGKLKLFPELRAALRPGRTLALLGASTLLIALNWLVYIWAVVNGRILEGSLGYYVNPLVSVLLGVLVLGERLERPVLAAIGVAAAGVLWLALHAGSPPWVALSLAISFGLYGLVRKLVPVGAVAALTVETALLLPLALGYLVVAHGRGRLVFLAGTPGRDLLLVLAGPFTAVPLLLFAGALRRLPLSTLGFLQYVSPTLQFLLAVIVYDEPFSAARGVAFVCIWTALAIFAVHTLRRGEQEPVTEA